MTPPTATTTTAARRVALSVSAAVLLSVLRLQRKVWLRLEFARQCFSFLLSCPLIYLYCGVLTASLSTAN